MKARYDPKAKSIIITLSLQGATVRKTRSGKEGYISFACGEDLATITAPDGVRYRLRVPAVNVFLMPVREEQEPDEDRDAMFQL